MLFGAHMSIAGGIPRAVERAVEFHCDVLQLFVKNANQWTGKALTPETVEEFKTARENSGLKSVVAHDSYLINLASPDDSLWEKSIDALVDEMVRSEALGLDYLVTHPGAHCGSGPAAGIRRVAEALDITIDRVPEARTRICLETTAGQGSALGSRFEEIRDILDLAASREKLRVCLDTCHIFAAGYDFRTREQYAAMFEAFDRLIGLGRLAVIHVNDSKKELGSRVDRHEHIGEGCVGREGFVHLVNDARFAALPKILETPKGDNGECDLKNLATLRAMVEST